MTKVCVLDFETNVSKGLHSSTFRDPSNDFYTIIIGDSVDTVTTSHSDSGFKRQFPVNLKHYINDADIIIGHNLGFDLGYVWHTEEIQSFIKRGGQLWDTQVAEYLISGQRHQFSSLAELQLIYLGEKVKESRISRLFSKGIGADIIIQNREDYPRTFKLFDKYSKGDGVTTLQIFYKQLAKVKELNMLPITKLYNRYLLALLETTTTGICIDANVTEKILQTFKLKSIDYLKRSSEIVGDYWKDERLPAFNIKSPTHKSALLFGGDIKCRVREDQGFYKNGNPKSRIVDQYVHVDGFGLSTEFTAPSEVKGRYQTGAEIIEKIHASTTDPIIKEYCELQRKAMNIEKMCSTYLEPFLNLAVNKRLYPNYNNTATTTGRLSSSRPNLQNIVSKGGMEKYIKRPLVSPSSDWKCCSIDFSQLEIYILALVSGDISLRNDLLAGIDFHILRLSYAEDMSYEEVLKLCKVDKLPEWELKRSKAKIISYQKAYGASPAKLAKTTGLDIEIIKKIFEKEDMTYTGVRAFNDHVAAQLQATKVLSLAQHIPKYKKGTTKGSKRFKGGVELLPVMKSKLNADYYDDLVRYIGYYRSITGKRYAFEEMADYDKLGRVRRGFAPTQIKNYPQQGGAADVVAAATSAVFEYVIHNRDKVRMVNQIHDSLEFYIHKDYLDLTISKLQSIMQDIPSLFKRYLKVDVPFMFKCDVKIGDNFADMQDYKIGGK